MLQRFSVKARVEGVGPVHHLIRGAGKDEVKAKLARAYPGRKISERIVRKREIEAEGTANG